MKKKILIFGIIILALFLFLVYFVGSGFLKNTSAFVENYTVSDDGKEITINFGVASSMGYIRDVLIHQQEGGKLYLDCYSAFGGFNGSMGAKNIFTFKLNEDTSVIAVYANDNCYKEVLVKNEDGTWERTKI